jgi:hypothetical protein
MPPYTNLNQVPNVTHLPSKVYSMGAVCGNGDNDGGVWGSGFRWFGPGLGQEPCQLWSKTPGQRPVGAG